MSDYLSEIQSMEPDANLILKRKEAERQRAEADKAERERQEALQAERRVEMDEESRRFGAVAVRYLLDQSVPDVGILAPRKTGHVTEAGRGWHVATRTFKEYGSKRTERIGLDSQGAVVTFTDTTVKDNKDQEWTGMVRAERVNDSERRHAILTSDYFKKGIAMLVQGHVPFEYIEPDKPVDDPSEPPLPGM